MMKITTLVPDKEILSELGSRLKKLRKQRKLNQDELAMAAGIGVATLRRIEDGQDSQLGSWIKLMKALDLLDPIDALLPENFRSPMAEAAKLGKAIKRREAKAIATGSPVVKAAASAIVGATVVSEAADDAPRTSIWGDERE